MFRGLILKESLESERVLDLVHIDKETVWQDVQGVEGQPTTWTALTVSVTPERLRDVLLVLEQDLRTKPVGWYADFSCGDDAFVVFPKKTFDIAEEGKEPAVRYGLSLGIPKAQLDF